MEDAPSRASAIPRLSRLPVSSIPKATSSLAKPNPVRATPSRENLSRSTAGTGERNSPKLLPSASRDQLRASVSYGETRGSRLRASASREQMMESPSRTPAPKPKAKPPVSMQKGSRVTSMSTPHRRTSTATSVALSPENEDPDPLEESDEVLFRRRLTLTRRPSETFSNSPMRDSATDPSDVPDGSSLTSSTEESSTSFDVMKARTLRQRPSLSERTMETLASIPPSPALAKKSSAFFGQDRLRTRPGSSNSRPGSSYNSDESVKQTSRPSSRPGSSSDRENSISSNSRASNNTFKNSLSTIQGTPERKSAGHAAPTPKPRKTPSRTSLAAMSQSSFVPPLPDARSPSPDKRRGTLPKAGSRTVSARPAKPRASVGSLFKKPSLPAMDRSAVESGDPRQASQGSVQSSANSWDGSIASLASTATSLTNGADSEMTTRKTSGSLREQIAKAKAAKRAAAKQASPIAQEEVSIVPLDDGFDFGMGHNDPFNLRKGEDPKEKVLSQRVRAARTSGRLNIAALSLKNIPAEVMKMYDMENIGANDVSWAESVDLTRLIAADNEFETLDDEVFPDATPESFGYEDGSQGSIFGGLNSMDLHNNLLVNVPLGWRRLPLLTSLNLSSNRLSNDSIEIISQMTALRDLKLANNLLFGPLHQDFSNLTGLEILDLKGNNVSALPRDLTRMQRLRILNLNENSFESLPFDDLAKLPLTELQARKNRLSGVLIEEQIESFPQLQTLDVSMNKLTHIVPMGSAISFPVLHALSLSMNRLQALPDMRTWTDLLTLTVDENSISGIPESFMGLEKLRHADFSSNDIRVVPPEIARMDNLSMIRLSGNPLRDRKFVSITTDELKEMLASRLEPPPPYQEPNQPSTITELMSKAVEPKEKSKVGRVSPPQSDRSDGDDDFATPPTSAHHSPAHSRSDTISSLRSRSQTLSAQSWPVKSGGLLDRSRTESSSLHPVVCSKVAADHQVKIVYLQHNLLSSMPNTLSFFAATLCTLCISNNQLVGETYLEEELDLPVLKELNLSSNRITTLEPLAKFLRAPLLEKVDVSLNRINAIPVSLKEDFPALTILLAANNHIVELDPQSIKGLKIVDASSNDISFLNPQLGLLGGRGGLQRLDLMGNRFRVPRWSTLELGTDATLRWLRSRVPVAEMAAWKKENGDDVGGDMD